MASRYWVGGSGNWSTSDTTHWATSSGGAGGASVPTKNDDVIFDTASGSANYTATITSTTVVCNNLTLANCSGGVLTLSGYGKNIYCYGNLTIGASVVISMLMGTIYFYASSGSYELTTNGVTIDATLSIKYSITLKLMDNLTLAYGITKTQSSAVFDANGKTVTLTNTATGDSLISGAFSGTSSFYNLTITGSGLIRFGSNTTVANTLTANGTSGGVRLTLSGILYNTIPTLTVNGSISASNLDIGYLNGAGTASWDISGISGGAGDLGNTSGITFTTPTTHNWTNTAGGLYRTASNWDTNKVPLAQDSCTFNCVFQSAKIVTLYSQDKIGNLDFASATWSGTALKLSVNGNANFYGNLKFKSGMGTETTNGSSAVYYFYGNRESTFTQNGVGYSNYLYEISVRKINGILKLGDNQTWYYYSAGSIVKEGTLDLSGYTLTAERLSFSSYDQPAYLKATGGGTIILTGTSAPISSIFYCTNVISAPTLIKLTGVLTADVTFSGGTSQTYGNLWNNTTGNYALTIKGSNTFNDIKIDAGRTVYFETGKTTTLNSLSALGTSDSHIVIGSTTSTNAILTKASAGKITSGVGYIDFSSITGNPDNTWYVTDTSTQVASTTRIYYYKSFDQSLADTMSLADDNSRLLVATKSPTDTVSISDSISRLAEYQRLIEDSISTTDEITEIYKGQGKDADDEVIVEDEISIVVEYQRTISDTISVADNDIKARDIVLNISDSISLAEYISDFDLRASSIIQRKTYLYKVYDEEGNFLEVWNDVQGEPEFSQEINSIGSTLTVRLARNSDSVIQKWQPILDNDSDTIDDSNDLPIMSTQKGSDKIGADSSLNHNNRVDVYVFYGQTFPQQIGYPNGVRIFTGFISEININYGSEENTEVLLMSYGFDLDQHLLTDSSNKTTIAYNSVDPSTIIRDGLTKFIAGSSGTYTTFTNDTVPLVNDYLVSYTFRVNTYKELIEKAVQLAPLGWSYYVGLGDNLVYFQPKPTQVAHYFILGKHIKSLALKSYIGDVVNDVTFTGGKDENDLVIYRRTTDTPLSATRRGLTRLSDSRVTNIDSADILARGEIDDKSGIKYRTTIAIIDKTYDIESIKLGELIGFRNFNNFIDELTMQIVAINYTSDVITLQLDSLPRDVPKRLEELRKAQDVSSNSETGDTPTQVT